MPRARGFKHLIVLMSYPNKKLQHFCIKYKMESQMLKERSSCLFRKKKALTTLVSGLLQLRSPSTRNKIDKSSILIHLEVCNHKCSTNTRIFIHRKLETNTSITTKIYCKHKLRTAHILYKVNFTLTSQFTRIYPNPNRKIWSKTKLISACKSTREPGKDNPHCAKSCDKFDKNTKIIEFRRRGNPSGESTDLQEREGQTRLWLASQS